jgi:hypothetical protein
MADTCCAGKAEPGQFLHFIVEGATPSDALVAIAGQKRNAVGGGVGDRGLVRLLN